MMLGDDTSSWSDTSTATLPDFLTANMSPGYQTVYLDPNNPVLPQATVTAATTNWLPWLLIGAGLIFMLGSGHERKHTGSSPRARITRGIALPA